MRCLRKPVQCQAGRDSRHNVGSLVLTDRRKITDMTSDGDENSQQSVQVVAQ